MNDVIEHKNWFQRNWKWSIPVAVLFFLFLALIATSKLGENIVGIAKVYSESEVCDGALKLAKQNEIVLGLLGELYPLGSLAILEGAHRYSDNYDTLHITFDVNGTKHERKVRSKMDVVAYKNGTVWEYSSIKIRIKKPAELKQTIQIIGQ